MPDKTKKKDTKSEKQARDDALIAAIAISIGLDGPMNPAMADPSPSPRRRTAKPVSKATTTGLAQAGKMLGHSLASGVEALALMPDPNDRSYWAAEKEGAGEVAGKDGQIGLERRGGVMNDVAEVGNAKSKAVESVTSAQGTARKSSSPGSAVEMGRK